MLEALLILLTLLCLYIWRNDRALQRLPDRVTTFSKQRWTQEMCRLAADQLAQSPLSVADQIPVRTGRRYIVVGGVCAPSSPSRVPVNNERF
jgi:hypothetical protein